VGSKKLSKHECGLKRRCAESRLLYTSAVPAEKKPKGNWLTKSRPQFHLRLLTSTGSWRALSAALQWSRPCLEPRPSTGLASANRT
jgi:hypothetical protein